MIVLKRWNNEYNQYTHDKNRHDYKHVLSLKKNPKFSIFMDTEMIIQVI